MKTEIEKIKIIDGVRCTKKQKGVVELKIPNNFTGADLQAWRDRNEIEYLKFKNGE